MKLIIAGSRSLRASVEEIDEIIELAGWTGKITQVISGTASGIDRAGEAWAAARSIPVLKMPAAWGLYDKAAGPIRNQEMARIGGALLLIWDGVSSGSRSMLRCMQELSKPIYVHRKDPST